MTNRKLKSSHKNLRIEEAGFIYCNRRNINWNFDQFIEKIFLSEEFDKDSDEFERITKDIRFRDSSSRFRPTESLGELTDIEWELILNEFGDVDNN